MSKVIIPADRVDLIELIISGYDFSDDMVLLYFRMSRTQYYDYVFNVLDKVKVTADLRGYSVDEDEKLMAILSHSGQNRVLKSLRIYYRDWIISKKQLYLIMLKCSILY